MLVRHPVAGWLGHRNNPPMKMLKSGSCKKSALAQQKRERDKDKNVFGDNIEREREKKRRKKERSVPKLLGNEEKERKGYCTYGRENERHNSP